MNESQDLFINLILSRGIVTQQQVDEALRLQSYLDKEGLKKHISEVFIVQGVLTPDQVEEMLQAQNKVPPAGPDKPSSHEADKTEQAKNFEGIDALLVINGKATNANVLIGQKNRFFIGSGQDADIRLENEGLAPIHCKIKHNGFDLIVFKGETDFPTLVNGHSIDFFNLQPGDKITIGSVSIDVIPKPKVMPQGYIIPGKEKKLQTVASQKSPATAPPVSSIDSKQLATYLIKNGYLNAQVVTQYLNELEKLKKEGITRQLWELLVENKLLTHQKYTEILEKLKPKVSFKCFKCQTNYNVTKNDINTEFKCRKCGEWLVVRPSLFGLDSSYSQPKALPQVSLFGDLAVKYRFITNEQLAELLQTQGDLKKEGNDISLDQLSFEKGILSEDQIQAIHTLLKQEVDENKINIEGFEIVKLIKRGTNSFILQAIQKDTGKIVALKVLPPELAENADISIRFHREAGIAAYINHANLICGLGVGYYEDYHYFVMEYVNGESIHNILQKSGAINYEETINIAVQIARGLDYLFKRNIIHRDIKPDHILMTKGGIVKLCSLGLAKSVGDSNITQQMEIKGTPFYISPEQAQGKQVDIRSDIYNLGATLYHMATGQVPFKGDSPIQTIMYHITREPILPHELKPGLPPHISHCIMKMMAKKREDRYQTPAELIDVLEPLL